MGEAIEALRAAGLGVEALCVERAEGEALRLALGRAASVADDACIEAPSERVETLCERAAVACEDALRAL